MIRTRKSGHFLLILALILSFAGTVGEAAYAQNFSDTQEPDTQQTDTQTKTGKRPDTIDSSRIVLDRPVLKCKDTTASKVYLTWKKISGAKRYYVYRAGKKDGKYKKVASTTKRKYTDKTVKSGRTYYYKIYAAGTNEENLRVVSKYSKRIKATTKTKVKKTAYVGDSVMSGLAVYGIVSGSGKKVVYKVGASPYGFYNGSTMDELLDYKPDRMFIMLGMNSLVGSPSGSQMDRSISSYKSIIEECLKENPDMQVIVLPVSPTRPSATVKNSNINTFNKKLKKMAKKLGVYYYDYTSCLKGSDGTLSSSYSAGDGIHLTPTAYRAFKAKLDSYGKKLD